MDATQTKTSAADWAELLSEARACHDAVRYQALARKASRLAEMQGLPAGHTPVRVALLGGASTDLITRPLKLALTTAGLAPELHVAPYNVWLQEMLEPDSGTSRFAPGVAILLLTPHNIPLWPRAGDGSEQAAALGREVCAQIFDACAGLHARSGTEILLNTFPPLPHRPLGNLSAKRADERNNFIRRLNVLLGDLAPSFVHLNDVAGLVEQHGLSTWLDERLWHDAKQPVAPAAIPELVRNTAAIVGSLLGRSRKCLVLDLDNTLWGGVVGDVGVEGIEVGEGGGVGEAFKTFQSHLKAIKERGVLLAVCSKNDEAQALRAFLEHPEMVLKRDDFVSFKANWEPKSDNLRAIARELNIGLDALVFLDDNPAEREEVRQALPEVSLIELTDDPADYPSLLDAARLFEVTAVTEEDRRRSEMYRGQRALAEMVERAERGEAPGPSRDLSGFLASLGMEAVVRSFEPMSLDRITQLVNKTNQFNLTTPRLTRAQVEELASDRHALTRTVRLADRFGDHGLISVLFGRLAGDTLWLDGWLMSCRVLKRGVERILLNQVVAGAAERGAARIVGIYVPTERNALVRDHYVDLGFTRVENGPGQPEGSTTWSLDVARFEPLQTFITLKDGGRGS